MALELSDLLIPVVVVKLELLVLCIGLLELSLEFLDSNVSSRDLLLLVFDGVENVLDFDLDVHADSLLLVDISVPDLNRELLLGNLFLVVNVLLVSVRDALQVVDHLVEDFDLLLDNVLILSNEFGMLDLEGFEIALRDFLEHGALDFLLLLGK